MATQSPVPLLHLFMDMVKSVEGENPGARTILRISKIAKLDWRKLTQSDWEAEHWEGEDQALTSLSSTDEVYLQALQNRLSRVGVSRVEIVDNPYMEVVPIPAAR